MMNDVLRVKGLSKHFSEVRAVDDLGFSVPKGQVYGFLGQNGAGKSTTIRMLLSLIQPASGSIQIFGKDLFHHRKEVLGRIGAIIEKPDLYKYLTAFENISIIARLSGLKAGRQQLMHQLERTGIAERAHSKVKTFSQGMKQRLGIACALVHDPELIILDEPTNGLDPQGIADVRNLILHLSRNELRTVFVSSHLLSEIELVADSMLIIDKGRKVTEGKVSELLDPADTIVQVVTTDQAQARMILHQSQFSRLLLEDERIILKMHKQDIPVLTTFLVENKVRIISIQPKHSLEDYFLSLTTANQHVAAYQY